MKSINRIIKEEYINLLREYEKDEEDIDYTYFNREDELKSELFSDFLYNNTPDFTKHVPWKVIPFARLKKIWEDFMTLGVVRDTRGLEMIKDLMIDNTMKVDIFTNLAGHTQWGDSEAIEENIGNWVDEQLKCLWQEKIEDRSQLEIPFNDPKKGYVQKPPAPPEEKCETTIHPFAQQIFNDNYEEGMKREKFREILFDTMLGRFDDYYQEDPENKMGGFISDYGLQPLLTLLGELYRSTKPETDIPIIDKMLNVVHQRSDIADWFVEGGSHALAQLSGSPSEVQSEVQ
jgi:hypothetical protein